MTITIPALVDAQLEALKDTLKPVYHSSTSTYSSPVPPYAMANRAADILRILTDLIDVSGLHVTGIHGAVDATNAVTAVDAIGQASGETLANEMKGDYNAHRILVGGGVHGSADSTNNVVAADADDEAKLVTLANDIRVKLIAHVIRVASQTHSVADPATVTLGACTDVLDAVPLLNQLKAVYNAHIANINGISTTRVADYGAFTAVNSLVGSTVTFAGNITTALAGVTAVVASNTTGVLNFLTPIPVSPVTGDHYTVSFTAIDKDLEVLEQAKGKGSTGSNPYGAGPSLINAIMVLIGQLGAAMPTFLTTTTANPFNIGSPHAGAGSLGQGGAILLASALAAARDAVAAYTKPA